MGPDATLDVQPTLESYERALALPADLPADLLARRPDIAAQRQRVEAAAARIGALIALTWLTRPPFVTGRTVQAGE